jgi:hypothetical protein
MKMAMKSDSGKMGEEEAVICFKTPWTRVLEKLELIEVVKKFHVFYGTIRFITVYTRACLRPPS